jgi:hypothetical protein
MSYVSAVIISYLSLLIGTLFKKVGNEENERKGKFGKKKSCALRGG